MGERSPEAVEPRATTENGRPPVRRPNFRRSIITGVLAIAALIAGMNLGGVHRQDMYRYLAIGLTVAFVILGASAIRSASRDIQALSQTRADPSLAERLDVPAGRTDGTGAENHERDGEADGQIPVHVLPVDSAEIHTRNQRGYRQDTGDYAAPKVRPPYWWPAILGGRPRLNGLRRSFPHLPCSLAHIPLPLRASAHRSLAVLLGAPRLRCSLAHASASSRERSSVARCAPRRSAPTMLARSCLCLFARALIGRSLCSSALRAYDARSLMPLPLRASAHRSLSVLLGAPRLRCSLAHGLSTGSPFPVSVVVVRHAWQRWSGGLLR